MGHGIKTIHGTTQIATDKVKDAIYLNENRLFKEENDRLPGFNFHNTAFFNVLEGEYSKNFPGQAPGPLFISFHSQFWLRNFKIHVKITLLSLVCLRQLCIYVEISISLEHS